jgi:TolA-binding protein
MKIKKQRSLLQDLKERNMVLEKREHLRVVDQVVAESDEMGESIGESIGNTELQSEPPTELPKSFLAASPIATPKNLPLKLPTKNSSRGPSSLTVVPSPILARTGGALAAVPVGLAPTPIAVSSEKTGEHYLYSKVLETYRMKKTEEMQKSIELLLKSYPESVFADNAIYLAGLLAFEGGDLTSALKQFDKLLRDYPRSNKAVAALYAKASIEKRSGRISDAKRGFLQVRDLYPGSPEAARVSVELKLLESASQKHREL